MRNIVIGVGNVLFKDEGVGIYASRLLRDNYSFNSELEIMDGGTLGFKLMTFFQEYDNVIILDTVSIEDKAGEVFRLPSDVLLGLGTYRKTAHEVEIVEMLEICSVLDKHANVVILGIIPEDIETVEIGLTKTIEEKISFLVDNAVKEVESLGIKATKKDDKSVKQIALEFMGSYNGEHTSRIPNDEDTTR